MRKLTQSAAVMALLAVATPGAALPVSSDFDFTTGGSITGNTGSFTGTNGLVVNLTAIFTDDTSGTPGLTRTGNGIGADAGSGFFENNQIDNAGPDEAVIFDFGVKSNFANSTLRLAGPGDQFRLFATNLDFTGGVDFNTLEDETSLASGTGCLGGNFGICDVELNFNSPDYYQYLVAAAPGTAGATEDSFRVASIDGVTPIPLPAAAWLLLAVSGGLIVAKRRGNAAV